MRPLIWLVAETVPWIFCLYRPTLSNLSQERMVNHAPKECALLTIRTPDDRRRENIDAAVSATSRIVGRTAWCATGHCARRNREETGKHVVAGFCSRLAFHIPQEVFEKEVKLKIVQGIFSLLAE